MNLRRVVVIKVPCSLPTWRALCNPPVRRAGSPSLRRSEETLGDYSVRVPENAPLITKKLLINAGGWPAMKQAEQLQAAGRVTEAQYEPPLLSGMVREGNRNLRSGLRVKTESDVENLCTCRESREWGKICPHALAVGLAFLEKAQAPAKVPPARSSSIVEERPVGPKFIELGSATAAAIALHFILPPNFAAAWAKGQVMLVTEVESNGSRAMPGVLLPNEQYGCDTFDLSALDGLGQFGALTGMRMLSREEFLRLLPSLRDHPRVTSGKSSAVEISAKIYRPTILLSQAGDASVKIEMDLAPNESLLAAGEEAWVFAGARFRPLVSELPTEWRALADGALILRGERAQRLLAFELPRLGEWFEVKTAGDWVLPEVRRAEAKFVLDVEGSLRELRANLRVRYGGNVTPLSSASHSEQAFLPGTVSETAGGILLRDPEAEKAAEHRLEQLGFARRGRQFVLANENAIARFFAFGFPRLQKEWDVHLSAQASKVGSQLEPLAPKIDVVASGVNWFELRYSLGTPGGEAFSAVELQRLLRSGQSKTRLRDGRIGVFDPEAIAEFEEVLRDCEPDQKQPGTYRIGRAHADFLAATVEDSGAAILDLGNALRSLTSDKGPAPPLGPIGEKLREYQRQGVSWLSRLARSNLGGILADEMGLGKTVQALAFLLAQRSPEPALIVCPTSLLANWRNEAKRWTPELRVLVLDGPERHQHFDKLTSYDIVLTSYALLQRDVEKYKSTQFSSAILDEAQQIKNPDTQNARAAFALRARHRFVLTGTPMENSVRDLWSLMNFTLPGYLGSRSDFRERYEQPLTRGSAPEVQGRLARRMRPFLLRRLKREVAKELPEKIEQQVLCDLSGAQRSAYDGLLREIQIGLTSDGKANAGAVRMKMLLGLLRLRQVCCDLRLLGNAGDAPAVSRDSRDTSGSGVASRAEAWPRVAATDRRVACAPQAEKAAEKNDSAKLELLDELLEEAIAGGHRVLVFSQFVAMLSLIRVRLETRNVRFSYLDGQTKERQAVVDQFQNDNGIPVFLMSLKAGGVGLNLSAADTVIHFDPWWNYAAEAQATDRAHRIGQARVVTAYKLIARNTVEEKIVKLQARKRSASEGLIGSEEPLMSGLTSKDLEELLS